MVVNRRTKKKSLVIRKFGGGDSLLFIHSGDGGHKFEGIRRMEILKIIKI